MKKRPKKTRAKRDQKNKSETLAIRIEKDLLARVRVACKALDRSVGHFVRAALRRELALRGRTCGEEERN
jgi:predicted HicB family RNase H-like nuclease